MKDRKGASSALLTRNVSTAILEFSLPMMLSSILANVYGAVDLFVVGQYSGSASVSAVSIGAQLMLLVSMLDAGISVGGTVELGKRIGENDKEGVSHTIGNIAILFTILALSVTPVLILCNPLLVTWMQTPEEAVSECRRYMMICSAGLPFVTGYYAVSCLYRAVGDSRTPVKFVAIACVMNIALDFLLTGYFGLGASGAAFATSLSQGFSFLIGLIDLKTGTFPYEVGRKYLKPDKGIIGRILRVGFPVSCQDVLVQFSFLVIAAIFNTLGLVASAAVGVAQKLMGFAFLIPSSFSAGIATGAAQNLGAGSRKRAREFLKYGIVYSVDCGLLIFILCQINSQMFVAIFSRDTAVIAAGGQYLKTYSLDCILTGFVFCINGYLNSNGKSMVTFLHSMAATFGVRIPLTWILSRIATVSLLPMGLAAPAASVLSIIICLIYFRFIFRPADA